MLLPAVLAPGISQATSLTTIYSFTGGVDGSAPTTGLVVGPGGALYGANATAVYELTQNPDLSWSVTPIYAANLISLVGTPDALYGVSGAAVVALTPPATGQTAWTSTSLHVFAGGKDGEGPKGIAIGPNGLIAGTTVSGGGASDACGSDGDKLTGCGTLFTLKKKNGIWKTTILHRFKGGNDGSFPFAAPSFDAKGNIYFSTDQGGGTKTGAARTKSSCDGDGTLGFYGYYSNDYTDLWEEACFALGPAFADSVLFDTLGLGSKDSQVVAGAAEEEIPGKAAHAIIATWTGGGITSDCPLLENNGCGVVGILTRPADGSTPWKLKVLHNFTQADGAIPSGYLTGDGANTIFGVAPAYGNACTSIGYGFGGCGTIFKLQNTANGWTWGGVVYRFPGGADGTLPVTQLLLYKGTLLGATKYGGAGCGAAGCGTLFSLTP